jgi:CBS domain-containing protein
MRTELVTADPDMSVMTLERLLAEHRIGGAPVISKFGEIVGVVSKSDVVNSFGDETSGSGPETRGRKVSEIMNTDVVTVQAFELVESVAALMLEKKIHCVVVYDEAEMVGIATSFDMLRVVVALAEAT